MLGHRAAGSTHAARRSRAWPKQDKGTNAHRGQHGRRTPLLLPMSTSACLMSHTTVTFSNCQQLPYIWGFSPLVFQA